MLYRVSQRRRWIGMLGVVLGLVLAVSLLPACGGGEPAAAPGASPTATAATTPAPTATTTAAPSPTVTATPTKPSPAPTTPSPTTTTPTIPPDARAVTLSFALATPPPGTARAKGLDWMIKEWERRSEGKVKIEPYWAQALLKSQEMVEGAGAGTADIAEVWNVYYAGKLSLWVMSDAVLFSESNPLEATLHVLEVAKNFPVMEQQFAQYNLKPLGWNLADDYDLITVKKPVQTLADMSGLKIGVFGGWIPKWIQASGATATSIPAPEVFDAMQRGMIDGRVSPFETAIRYGWWELIQYITEINSGSLAAPVVPSMNLQVWNSLHPAIQEMMLQVGEEATYKTGEFFADELDGYMQQYRDRGIQILDFPQAEREKWMAIPVVKALPQAWADDNNAKGYPGSEIMKAYLEAEGLSQQYPVK